MFLPEHASTGYRIQVFLTNDSVHREKRLYIGYWRITVVGIMAFRALIVTALFACGVASAEKASSAAETGPSSISAPGKATASKHQGNTPRKLVPGDIVSTRQKKNGVSEEFFLQVVEVIGDRALLKNAPRAHPYLDSPQKTVRIRISELKFEPPLKAYERMRKQNLAKEEAAKNRERARHAEEHARWQKEKRNKPIEGVRFSTDEIRERENQKKATGCSIGVAECKKRCNLDWGALQMCKAQCEENYKNCGR